MTNTYDTDRAGLVSTAQLALEQSKHEGHARRQEDLYVPWPKLLLTGRDPGADVRHRRRCRGAAAD